MADLRELIGTVAGSQFFNCPVGVSVGSIVYVSGANTVDKALAKKANPDAIGIVIRKPTTTTCLVISHGKAGVFSGLTPGGVYYLSADTAGEVTDTPPSGVGDKVQLLGIAINSTDLYMDTTYSVLAGGGSSTDAFAFAWFL